MVASKSLPMLAGDGLVGRRCVLAALGGLTLVGCFPGDTTTADAGDDAPPPCDPSLGTDLGSEASFPVGSWQLVGQIVVAQDANGFFAFSAICTHQGCLLDPPASDGSTFCQCHGSQFDGNGAVMVGPAHSPLQHYAVNVCNGDVFVDTSTVVAASTRTPAV
jgi:cytochrome b6-f complex iron-sulfur subunit